MTVNMNTTTGIRYGVIAGNNVPDLMEDIISNGTDTTFEAYKAECVKEVAALLEQRGQRNAKESATSIVDDYEWDNYQCDEPEYTWEDGSNHYMLGYLGGAPIIWIIQSEKIIKVRSLCSPCVPNAGDIDSGIIPADEDNVSGWECYGVPDGYEIAD